MANFEIPENPEFSTVMRRLETTDPAAADLFNTMFAQLLENDVAIVGGTTKVGNTQKLNGLTAEEFVNNGNMLINTDFSNPVNSSGKTEWNGKGTFIDGWESTSHNTVYATLDADGIIFGNTENTNGYIQALNSNNGTVLSGNNLTLSIMLSDGTLKTATGMYSGGSNWDVTRITIGSATFYVVVTSGVIGVQVRVNQGETPKIRWVKLELGSIATPFIPPNKEVEKLKCGATVGDAESVNGVTFYTRYEEIDSSFSNQTPIVDLVEKMVTNSRFFVTVYGGSLDVYPAAGGVLEIDKHGVSGNYTSVKFTRRDNGYFWTGCVQNAVFTGWKFSGDGGNANTVNGHHASDFNRNIKEHPIFNVNGTNYTTYMDAILAKFSEGYIKGKIFTAGYRCTDIPTSDTWSDIEWESLFGTRIFFIKLRVDQGRGIYFGVYNYDNGATSISWKNLSKDLPYLPLDGGKVKNLTIARENNASEGGELVLEKASDSILNGDIAIDIFTNKLRFYEKDGNNYRGVHIDLSLCENNVKSTLLHTGNSKATVISNTAPTDTSALWYDTTNKVCKYYKDGAWQQ